MKEILDFKNFILNQGLSDNTAIGYCLDVEEFFNICKIYNVKNLTEDDIKKWSLEIKKKAINNRTVNRKIASIKKFINFIQEKYDIYFNHINYSKYFKNLKIRDKILKIPTIEDIFIILKYIKNYRNEHLKKISLDLNNLNLENLTNYNLSDNIKISKKNQQWEDFRNYLIVKIIFTFGLRVSEICSLKIEDFISIDNYSREIIFKKNFTIKGKGNKERMLPLLDFIAKDILELLKSYPKNILNIEKNCFEKQNLFVKKNSKHITSFDIEQFLREVKYELGIAFDINPHIFRHACGTYLLENGVNIREIQVLLGHSDLSTTQKYTKVSKKTLILGLEKVKI